MISVAITKGVKVSVETFYQPQHSQPQLQAFVFAYKITIENYNTHSVQLIHRYWTIKESFGVERTVEGEGVVGQQPIIEPLGIYQYISACQLVTEIGRMWGSYLMQIPNSNETFNVSIPAFQLIAPFKMN